MCGICGIFHAEGEPASLTVLQRMVDSMAHRGPDGDGTWLRGPVGLGHRRLAITDLTLRGHQPMQRASGRAILVYNGEIYNYRELRIELARRGYEFRSTSDTEVLLNSYREWGKQCVTRFNGMFAFAIWDEERQQVFAARDRYGIKPLYYWYGRDTLLFASEIKSILQHPLVTVRPCVPALNEYFTFQNVFSDLTLFEGIRMLPPAHVLTLRLGSRSHPVVERYWSGVFTEDHTIGEREATEELRRLFEQAVNRQLMGDVPVGSYLSGGVDSGAITCVAAGGGKKHLTTFTGGFDLSSARGLELEFDERARAEVLSRHCRTEQYEVVLKPGDMERVMPALIWHLEDLRVGQCYPIYYVARLASRFVKVVLSGTGGDELFGGYPWRYYRAVVNDSDEEYLRKYHKYWQRLVPDRLKARFFRPSLHQEILRHPTEAVFRSVMAMIPRGSGMAEDFVNRSLQFEMQTFLPGLLLVEDKLNMAHGVETRVPFLDNDLVEFALRLPVRYKLRDLAEVVRLKENDFGPKTEAHFNRIGGGKVILRELLASYLPDDYAQSRKQGFSAPDASWFRGESMDYVRGLLHDGHARLFDYLQPDTVHALLNEHFDGEQNHRLLIWSLLSFETWCRTFLDRSPTGPIEASA